jgi:glycerol-3-phosphate dehydrogenase
MGKGVLIAPTAHENLIIGPNAEDIQEKEANETTFSGLNDVWSAALKTLPELNRSMTITTFSGIRAQASTGDFIVCDYPELPGFIDVAGIKSPGLTAAPAIAEYVVELLKKQQELTERKNFTFSRRKQIRFHTLSHKERAKALKKDPNFGRIICRCEGVTEAEIIDVIHRNAGARTLDSVKRRTRSGGGRCQGGFCSPKIIEILARELGISQDEVLKDSSASRIIIDQTKKEAGND